MKKIISTMLLVIVLFNFILGSNKSYADTVKYNSTSEDEISEAMDAETTSSTR
jgi:hypothetical protein